MAFASVREVVPTLDDFAFFACKRLTSLHFDANSPLREIGRAAFGRCDSLTSVVFPNALEKIGRKTFDDINDDLTLYVEAGSTAE